ncbi:dihydrofolate reductase [Melaminivora alkalimesophila]|uniref:Dihydrofolate reductase n=1 Tax=Melaminivora alkalimesophila TaxID=1165852 RepID=A0A317R8J3_9BURK|nr:dihydrofolate reductase [Melaminivora alkalimesophila]PWW43557.1 dihydrofolate reductase [Melaminivora alkalimesophila]
MQVALIYARALNGVIGRDGTMPWHLPEDLAHFRALTQGCPVIMGRKTWDSLPPRFRPLPERRNIVVTRQAHWRAPGAERSASVEDALALARRGHPATAWVIGGAQIYAQVLPLADRVEVTEIGTAFEGDAWAPELGPEWIETLRSPPTTGAGGLPYSFVRYERRTP